MRIFSLSSDTQSSNGSKSFNHDSPREFGVLRQEMQTIDDEEKKIFFKNFCTLCQSPGHPLSPFIRKLRQELYQVHSVKAYVMPYHTVTFEINNN